MPATFITSSTRKLMPRVGLSLSLPEKQFISSRVSALDKATSIYYTLQHTIWIFPSFFAVGSFYSESASVVVASKSGQTPPKMTALYSVYAGCSSEESRYINTSYDAGFSTKS